MLPDKRHTAVLALGFVVIALVVSCGGTQPQLDIDATVEARVERANASLVAPTAAPLPTYAPLPTATPTPTPANEFSVTFNPPYGSEISNRSPFINSS